MCRLLGDSCRASFGASDLMVWQRVSTVFSLQQQSINTSLHALDGYRDKA